MPTTGPDGTTREGSNWNGSKPSVGNAPDRAFTPIESLMRCAPGDEPERSQMELLALRDALNDVLEQILTRQELWLFNLLVVERRSFRNVERLTSIPRTTLLRKRDSMLERLREALAGSEIVAHFLSDD